MSEKLEHYSNWTIIISGSHVIWNSRPMSVFIVGCSHDKMLLLLFFLFPFSMIWACLFSKWAILQIIDMADFHGIIDTDNLCNYCIRNLQQVSGNTSTAQYIFICCWQVSGLEVSHDTVGLGLHDNYLRKTLSFVSLSIKSLYSGLNKTKQFAHRTTVVASEPKVGNHCTDLPTYI